MYAAARSTPLAPSSPTSSCHNHPPLTAVVVIAATPAAAKCGFLPIIRLDCPPLRIRTRAPAGGTVTVSGVVSSAAGVSAAGVSVSAPESDLDAASRRRVMRPPQPARSALPTPPPTSSASRVTTPRGGHLSNRAHTCAGRRAAGRYEARMSYRAAPPASALVCARCTPTHYGRQPWLSVRHRAARSTWTPQSGLRHTNILAGGGRTYPRAELAGRASVPLPSCAMGLPASDWSNYEALLPRPSYSKEGRGYASRSTTIPQVRTYLRQEGTSEL